MKNKIAIIGAGFSGLAAAACLAKQGLDVTLFEKNAAPGGRAGQIKAEGFTFDKGPARYWIPDVYEKFFAQFNKKPADYYSLKRLDPLYRAYFDKNDYLDIPAGFEDLKGLFENIETGASGKLSLFLKDAGFKYKLAINRLIYKPSLSVWEFLEPWFLGSLFRCGLIKSFSSNIRSYFLNPKLIRLLEYPALYLGATARKTPSLYSLINYADLVEGGWYPSGGIYSVVEGFYKLSLELGVKYFFNSPVEKIQTTEGDLASGLWIDKQFHEFDIILATADYHHVENVLLQKEFQSYSHKYWETRKLSPSLLVFYIGLRRKLPSLKLHNLFLDQDSAVHSGQIYNTPQWPENPVIFIACPSKSDNHLAPEGCETLVVQIPVASGLVDTDERREKYLELFLDRFKTLTGDDISKDILYKKSFAQNDLIKEFNSFKGNASGLSNTRLQTAIFKPSIKSRKIKNLFYAGHMTIPGPGLASSVVSGQIVANEILKRL